MSHDIGDTAQGDLLAISNSGVTQFVHTYTEMIVKGMTPQLPINDGLTIHPDTLLSRVHKAS
jgi:hypothetical protein